MVQGAQWCATAISPDFGAVLLKPDLERPVADADKPALLIRQIRTRDVVLTHPFPTGLLSNDRHGVVVHPLAVVTIHADRVQLREPVDLYFGNFKNSVPPASSVGSARVSDPWARLSGTTQSVRSTAPSPSKTAQSCDSVVPRRDERRLQ